MTPDFDRIYRFLESIDSKLDAFRQETERRLAVLEERGSAERIQGMEKRLAEMEQFRAMAKVYLGLAAGTAGAFGAVAAALLLKLFGVHL